MTPATLALLGVDDPADVGEFRLTDDPPADPVAGVETTAPESFGRFRVFYADYLRSSVNKWSVEDVSPELSGMSRYVGMHPTRAAAVEQALKLNEFYASSPAPAEWESVAREMKNYGYWSDDDVALRRALWADPTAAYGIADRYADADRSKVAADWASKAGAVARSYAEFGPFYRALMAVDVARLPVRQDIGRTRSKELAAAIRELLRTLKVVGCSVTTDSSVSVKIPHTVCGTADCYLVDQHCNEQSSRLYRTHPATVLGKVARDRVAAIISRVFPQCEDRSDSMTDYFNYCWMVSNKSDWEYRDKEPAKPKATPAPKPDGWESWPVLLGHKVERLAAGPAGFTTARYRLHGTRGAVYLLLPNKTNPAMLYAVAVGPKVRGGWKVGKVSGYGWFHDAPGGLTPVR